MREIKFRAWSAIDKVMWTHEEICYDGVSYKEVTTNLEGLHLMQFTGLLDKQGVEIYEGDIVRWGLGFTGNWDKESWHRYAVVELFPSLQFKIIYYVIGETGERKKTDNHIFEFGHFAYKETHKYLEVIGNIYENSNLLGDNIEQN